jgi:hypothetical protein
MKLRKKIIIIILSIVFLSFWTLPFLIKFYDYKYLYSDSGESILTIVKYLDNKTTNSESGFYVQYGKIKKSRDLPQDNYIKFSGDTQPLWIYFQDDSCISILYSMGEILENRLKDSRITIRNFLSDEEIKEISNGHPEKYKVVFFHDIPD